MKKGWFEAESGLEPRTRGRLDRALARVAETLGIEPQEVAERALLGALEMEEVIAQDRDGGGKIVRVGCRYASRTGGEYHLSDARGAMSALAGMVRENGDMTWKPGPLAELIEAAGAGR